MDCRSAVEVCELIVERAAEFNHVNVATALRKVLQSRGDGVPRQLEEQALHALEAAALRMIDAFEAQQVANTLHLMAKFATAPGTRHLSHSWRGGRRRWRTRSTRRMWQTRCGRMRRWGGSLGLD